MDRPRFLGSQAFRCVSAQDLTSILATLPRVDIPRYGAVTAQVPWVREELALLVGFI